MGRVQHHQHTADIVGIPVHPPRQLSGHVQWRVLDVPRSVTECWIHVAVPTGAAKWDELFPALTSSLPLFLDSSAASDPFLAMFTSVADDVGHWASIGVDQALALDMVKDHGLQPNVTVIVSLC